MRGVVRLISSARSTSAKTGPGRNSNSRVCWSKTRNPVMSPGSRSGVHWTRANLPPSACARALARVVLPRPGRSSTSRCPRASRQASTCSTTSALPRSARVQRGADSLDRAGMSLVHHDRHGRSSSSRRGRLSELGRDGMAEPGERPRPHRGPAGLLDVVLDQRTRAAPAGRGRGSPSRPGGRALRGRPGARPASCQRPADTSGRG